MCLAKYASHDRLTMQGGAIYCKESCGIVWLLCPGCTREVLRFVFRPLLRVEGFHSSSPLFLPYIWTPLPDRRTAYFLACLYHPGLCGFPATGTVSPAFGLATWDLLVISAGPPPLLLCSLCPCSGLLHRPICYFGSSAYNLLVAARW